MKIRLSRNKECTCGQCKSEIRLHGTCSLISDLHCPQNRLLSCLLQAKSEQNIVCRNTVNVCDRFHILTPEGCL